MTTKKNGATAPKVEHRVCPVNGRAKIECAMCGADNAAQADWNSPGLCVVVCGVCGGHYRLAAEVTKLPDPLVLAKAGAYSTELALGCAGKNGKVRAMELGEEHPHHPDTAKKRRKA